MRDHCIPHVEPTHGCRSQLNSNAFYDWWIMHYVVKVMFALLEWSMLQPSMDLKLSLCQILSFGLTRADRMLVISTRPSSLPLTISTPRHSRGSFPWGHPYLEEYHPIMRRIHAANPCRRSRTTEKACAPLREQRFEALTETGCVGNGCARTKHTQRSEQHQSDMRTRAGVVGLGVDEERRAEAAHLTHVLRILDQAEGDPHGSRTPLNLVTMTSHHDQMPKKQRPPMPLVAETTLRPRTSPILAAAGLPRELRPRVAVIGCVSV